MYISLAAFLPASLLVGKVFALAYVPYIIINGTTIPGWDITTDSYAVPQPLRVVRPTKPDGGFVSDPKSPEITCWIGNSKLPPGPISATVAAGETVTVMWNINVTWPKQRPTFGTYFNFLARCPSASGGCSAFKGDTGSPWFKIQQDTYKNGEWASETVAKNKHRYNVKIPKMIQEGIYILRHEHLALHEADKIGGAQFYPVCMQLTVTGGGSLNPSGLSFPGAYSATDPGIHFDPYQGDAANEGYIPPGGPVYPGLN